MGEKIFLTHWRWIRERNIGGGLRGQGCSSKKHGQSAYGVFNMHGEKTSWAVYCAVDHMWRSIDHMVDRLALTEKLQLLSGEGNCTSGRPPGRPSCSELVSKFCFDADFVSDLVSFN